MVVERNTPERVECVCSLCLTMAKLTKSKKKKLQRLLPLMHTLFQLKPQQRVLVLEHLDTEACQSVKDCISHVLRDKSSKSRKKLSPVVKKNKKLLESLLKASFKKGSDKRKLASIGGSTLTDILSFAIPILLSFL